MKFKYPCVIRKKKEGEGFHAWFPDLEGCVADGLDLEDTKDHARDAQLNWLVSEIEEELELPELSHEEDLELEEGDIVKYLTVTIPLMDGFE